MKILRSKLLPLLFVAAVAGTTGCKKYIDETNLGTATDQLYYVTSKVLKIWHVPTTQTCATLWA